jgi:hypothetical protein
VSIITRALMCQVLWLQSVQTIPSFRLRILNTDGDVVQDNDTDLIRFPNGLLGQDHTNEMLPEEAKNGIRHITEGLANETISAFVVVVAVGNGQNHMFAVVNKLGVWLILDSATQEVT